MFSISELACASGRGSVLISTPWLGISSTRAVRAEIQCLSTARVSCAVAGGSGGRALKGSSGDQLGRLGGRVRTGGMVKRCVAAFDTSTRRVEKNQNIRHGNWIGRNRRQETSERLNEALAIGVIHKDLFTSVTAIHDGINCASILDSQLAGHVGRVAFAASLIIIKN